MLSSADKQKMRGGFEQVVGLLGVPATWRQVKAPNGSHAATVGFRTAGKDDQEVVQAYGIDTVIITCLSKDFPTAPVKFDEFEIMTETYVANAVHPIHLNAELIGYKVLARGR